MKKEQCSAPQGRLEGTILDAEIKEFQSEIDRAYHTWDSLASLGNRYDSFCKLAQGSNEAGKQLYGPLLNAAARALVEGSFKLIQNYLDEHHKYKVSDKDKPKVNFVCNKLTLFLKGNFSKELKDRANSVADDISKIVKSESDEISFDESDFEYREFEI